MLGFELNTVFITAFGLIGWGLAVYLYGKFTDVQKKNGALEKQKQHLKEMISEELKTKYEEEISELKRYQTYYLIHMEERDKLLSSLSTLIRAK